MKCSVSAGGRSLSQGDNQAPENPPDLTMAILNATKSLSSSSINPPVIIIRKPYPEPASITGQSGSAQQAQMDPIISAAEDCAAPSVGLVSGTNHVTTLSNSSSLAYTTMTSLPVTTTNLEEANVPCVVEAVVSAI